MRAPFHLWIIGILSLLWNAGGAFDYLAVKLKFDAYLSQFNESQMAFFDDLPLWYTFAWAVGVWFSVLGSILLLARSRVAGAAFGLSLLGLLAASYYSFVVVDSSPMRDAGPAAMAFTAAIYIVLVLLWLYARVMTRRGVLR